MSTRWLLLVWPQTPSVWSLRVMSKGKALSCIEHVEPRQQSGTPVTSDSQTILNARQARRFQQPALVAQW